MSAPVSASSRSASRAWLAPFVPLYRLGLALRERRLANGSEPVRRLQWPVVSIGNLSAGGAGKTPLTIALAKALAARGLHVDVLSRGYGRAGSGTALVQKEGRAEHFGDEPLLIAREAGVPVYVAARRYAAGLLAESNGAAGASAVHLLDDGFQHRQLHRDVDILLLNRRDWNDRLLPAGNLREELSAALRADVIAISARDPEFEAELRAFLATQGWQGKIWRLTRRMYLALANERDRPPKPAVAFCGIARPEQFFAGLEAAGVRLAERIAFPDHHRYTARDCKRLKAAQRRANAVLLTTAKDAVRLQPVAGDLLFQVAALRIEVENEPAALDWLVERLRQGSRRPE